MSQKNFGNLAIKDLSIVAALDFVICLCNLSITTAAFVIWVCQIRTLEDFRNLATIFSSLLAAGTLVKGVVEYNRQNTLKQFEFYFQMRDKLDKIGHSHKLYELLNKDDLRLRDVPYSERIKFLGFYEDIAYLVKSGYMRKDVAHYMFSYFAKRCESSFYFWRDIDKKSEDWKLFNNFVRQMRELDPVFLGGEKISNPKD